MVLKLSHLKIIMFYILDTKFKQLHNGTAVMSLFSDSGC